MNRRKCLYALLIATVVVSSGCLMAAAANTITMQWVKHFWVSKPRPPVICEIVIQGPKVVGYPVYINVTLKIEDAITSLSGNLTVNLYWYNWTYPQWRGCDKCTDQEWREWDKCTADTWQHVATLLPETNVTLTHEKQTWALTYIPECMGVYKVVVTFTTETGTETFTSE